MKACANEQNVKLALTFYGECSQVSSTRSVIKGESSCKRMGGNLFTHAMSEAEVQSHEVRLKLRVSESKGIVYFYFAEQKQFQAHEVPIKGKS